MKISTSTSTYSFLRIGNSVFGFLIKQRRYFLLFLILFAIFLIAFAALTYQTRFVRDFYSTVERHAPPPPSGEDLGEPEPEPEPDPEPDPEPEYSIRIDDYLDRFDEGSFSYNRITEMWRNRPETVILRIAADADASPVLPHGLSGDVHVGSTIVGVEMSAELIGSGGLLVSPEGQIRRRISNYSDTTWQWTVTPTHAGTNNVLTLNIFVDINNLETDDLPAQVLTYTDVIEIKVGRWLRFKDAVNEVQTAWLLLVGVVPALWGVYKTLRRRKRSDATPRQKTHRERMKALMQRPRR